MFAVYIFLTFQINLYLAMFQNPFKNELINTIIPNFEQSDVAQVPPSQDSLSKPEPSHFAAVMRPPLAETG